MISQQEKTCIAGGAKDGIGRTNEPEVHTPLPESHSSHKLISSALPETDKTPKGASTSSEHENVEGSAGAEDKLTIAADSEPMSGNKCDVPSASSPPRGELNSLNDASKSD